MTEWIYRQQSPKGLCYLAHDFSLVPLQGDRHGDEFSALMADATTVMLDIGHVLTQAVCSDGARHRGGKPVYPESIEMEAKGNRYILRAGIGEFEVEAELADGTKLKFSCEVPELEAPEPEPEIYELEVPNEV